MRWVIYYFTLLFSTLLDTVVVWFFLPGNLIPTDWSFLTLWLFVFIVVYVLSTAPGMATIYSKLFPDKMAEIEKIGWVLAKRK
jgi:hypothetical protein